MNRRIVELVLVHVQDARSLCYVRFRMGFGELRGQHGGQLQPHRAVPRRNGQLPLFPGVPTSSYGRNLKFWKFRSLVAGPSKGGNAAFGRAGHHGYYLLWIAKVQPFCAHQYSNSTREKDQSCFGMGTGKLCADHSTEHSTALYLVGKT